MQFNQTNNNSGTVVNVVTGAVGPQMKRWLLFWGRDDTPRGGWFDFRGSFDTREEALQAYSNAERQWLADWFQVVDTADWRAYAGMAGARGGTPIGPYPLVFHCGQVDECPKSAF